MYCRVDFVTIIPLRLNKLDPIGSKKKKFIDCSFKIQTRSKGTESSFTQKNKRIVEKYVRFWIYNSNVLN